MYILLVIGYQDQSWLKEKCVEIEDKRFLEYTTSKIKKIVIDNEEASHIIGRPCLVMREGDNPTIYLGKITCLKYEDSFYKISLDFNEENNFQFSDIKNFLENYDIHEWEKNRTHLAIKDGDLGELLSNSSNIPKDKLDSLITYLNSPMNYGKFKYELPRLTVSGFEILHHGKQKNTVGKRTKITSITDFIKRVLDKKPKEEYRSFYRGHSKYSYELIPSLCRTNTDGSYQYLENEDKIYHELLTENYEEFESDKSTFDRLVRMQHFTLPTRLLDITTNPLIALYFACRGNSEDDGDVVFIKVPNHDVLNFDSDKATIISNLCKLSFKNKERLNADRTIEILRDDEQYAMKLYHAIRDDKPYFQTLIQREDINKVLCIKGKITNARIRAQSGAFLLFGLDASLNDDNNFEIEHYQVDKDSKEKILKELDLLNINESTLFPYLQNSAKYISNEFKNS